MDIFKLIGIGLIGGFLSLMVKNYRREFSVLIGAATAIAILLGVADMLGDVINSFRVFAEKSGVDIKYFTIVIKVVGVAYITQFAAEILRDGGENAIALKVELAGKIFILGITLPILTSFLEVCINALDCI
jgi:stage III sporulation protein AD